MIYRETGQFKTAYASDQQLFPILQDRIFILLLLAFAFGAVPLLASEYLSEGPGERVHRPLARRRA